VTSATGFTWTVMDTNLITQDDRWGEVLVECARRDPRIVALSADLARSTKIGRFLDAFPERFFNVGIAEQNLMAVASGLAAMGLVPVVSTYAAFASLRAAEFVRTDIAYNHRNVKIVATLSGVSFGQGGPTHHAVEDLALLTAIPGMTVVAPSDGQQAGEALAAALAHDGPVYIRLARGMEPVVPRTTPFVLGRANWLCEGTDVTVIATGVTVLHAVRAAERAARQGLSVGVLEVHTLKPLDAAAVLEALGRSRRVITVEDHGRAGGLGGAVAAVIAESGKGCAFRRLGHPDAFSGMGIPEDLMHRAGLDDDGILAAVAALMKTAVASDGDWNE